MQVLNQFRQEFSVSITRVFLGLLFFFQGYDAVFKIKIRNVINTYQNNFANKGIPRFMTVSGSWFTSYAEFIGGGIADFRFVYLSRSVPARN